jgi:hypothetical protein
VGSIIWLAYAYVTLCQDDVTSGTKVLYPYQLCLIPTHIIFITIAILVFDRVIKRHEGLLALVLDHYGFSRVVSDGVSVT